MLVNHYSAREAIARAIGELHDTYLNELLNDEHADVLRDSVDWMAHQLMEAEVANKIGAELGERTRTG
jgi:hypothetical protein